MKNRMCPAICRSQMPIGTAVLADFCRVQGSDWHFDEKWALQKLTFISDSALLAKAGIRPVRLYDLRHTAATLGIAARVSVKAIADQLGQPGFHSPWSAIRVYCHQFRTKPPRKSKSFWWPESFPKQKNVHPIVYWIGTMEERRY
jgi:hypothetical protein